MVTPTQSAVSAFFESYRAAFERSDTQAIVEHFAFPCHITNDTDEIELMVVPNGSEWAGAVNRLIGRYRDVGVSSVRMLDLLVTQLSPHLSQAFVRWGLYDRSSTQLYTFEALYTIASIGDMLRITAVSNNEVPRYRECVSRLKFGTR